MNYVTNFEEISAIKEQRAKGNNQKIMSQQLKSIDVRAKEVGLHLDKSLLENLSLVLNYGFQDQFEVQMEFSKLIFSANLNRSHLREPEELMIRKYSRQSEVEFTLFGIITQHQREKLEELEEKKELSKYKRSTNELYLSYKQC